MRKTTATNEPQLVIRDYSISVGKEWPLRVPGWTVIQICKGHGFFLQPGLNLELAAGAVLLTAGGLKPNLRASQLGELSFCWFKVMPERLSGFLTLSEVNWFKTAAEQKAESVFVYHPGSPESLAMAELLASESQGGLRFRLKLFQLFVELLGGEMEQANPPVQSPDARQRLENLFKQTPAAEMLGMDFKELARLVHCTPRHVGRLFQDLTGMSFRRKRTELRLARAVELLAASNSKIVDVALESGFQSLSLFNLMFARQFGMSPGKWRQQQNRPKGKSGNKPVPPRPAARAVRRESGGRLKPNT